MKEFEVEVLCQIRKRVTCLCETEEQARENPWEHAVDESELYMYDWEVRSVKEVI